jgi:UDP-N-acetylglucosamine enolpyruvyl transferase
VDSIWIRGGERLKGEIPISGAKNAALTLMPCALLTDEKRLAAEANFIDRTGIETGWLPQPR